MVDALKLFKQSEQATVVHQLLHGYADGHRLIESSFKPHEDLTRLMLRMSDLSGSSMTTGFEEYITGYPLTPINAFALAKTWYAPEMPRPGCVWTHTLVIPKQTLSRFSNLADFVNCFRRPTPNLKGSYSSAIQPETVGISRYSFGDGTELLFRISRLLQSYYENAEKCILIPAANAKEYETALFAIWSQQWLSLRENLTFCTGALSSRNYAGRPFVIQCVPKSMIREVQSEVTTLAGQPTVLDSAPSNAPGWIAVAAKDALDTSGGELREFLWKAADTASGRKEFVPFVEVFEAINSAIPTTELVNLVAKVFPESNNGDQIKASLFGSPKSRVYLAEDAEEDILLALGKTEHFQAFDVEALHLRERGKELLTANAEAGRRLLGELFRSANLHGEMILVGLISGLDPKTARHATSEQPQFLPALFRAKPSLACSPELWEAAGSHRWELLESLATNADLDAPLIAGIVGAILDSGSDSLIRRAVSRWGNPATFGALDWIEAHQGKMSEDCRKALTFEDKVVSDWVAAGQSRSIPAIIAAAHIVAPFAYHLWDKDYTAWLNAFHNPQFQGDNYESTYLCTFLLALAFGNAPPNAINLVSETFERVHSFFETAHEISDLEKIADESWVIMDPIVPHLNWLHEWDKCERLRRGLALAFIKHEWPPTELSNCIHNDDLLVTVVKSAKRVDGGGDYFQISRSKRH
jgi:hypothetical protein